MKKIPIGAVTALCCTIAGCGGSGSLKATSASGDTSSSHNKSTLATSSSASGQQLGPLYAALRSACSSDPSVCAYPLPSDPSTPIGAAADAFCKEALADSMPLLEAAGAGDREAGGAMQGRFDLASSNDVQTGIVFPNGGDDAGCVNPLNFGVYVAPSPPARINAQSNSVTLPFGQCVVEYGDDSALGATSTDLSCITPDG
jgi:hypothetical protein